MKRWLIAVGLGMAVGAVVLAQSAQKAPEPAKVEEELRKLVGQWLDAEARGDSALLNRLFADDFIGTAFGGNIVSKEDVIPPQGAGEPRMPKSVVKESVVRRFGSAGVVMGRVAVEDPQQPGQFRFTLVCIERDARWQVVAAHLSRVPPSE